EYFNGAGPRFGTSKLIVAVVPQLTAPRSRRSGTLVSVARVPSGTEASATCTGASTVVPASAGTSLRSASSQATTNGATASAITDHRTTEEMCMTPVEQQECRIRISVF